VVLSSSEDGRPAAVVFDLDGTLVLTEERNAEVWRTFLARYGLSLTSARLRQVTGRRGLDSLTELTGELPDRFAGRSPVELVEEVRELEAATPLGQVQEVPGARALVRRLVDSGVTVALCTSATRPYALACRAVEAAPAQAVAFEDSVAGVEAVLGAGLRCVGVATTLSREALSRADAVVDDLVEAAALGWPLPAA
jgi:sugar-phosphatase